MAHKNLLSLYIIGSIQVVINSPTIESGARHVLAPAAHTQVIERKVLILTMNL